MIYRGKVITFITDKRIKYIEDSDHLTGALGEAKKLWSDIVEWCGCSEAVRLTSNRQRWFAEGTHRPQQRLSGAMSCKEIRKKFLIIEWLECNCKLNYFNYHTCMIFVAYLLCAIHSFISFILNHAVGKKKVKRKKEHRNT